ncbi:MAG: class I tRNA ligase family protein, partial [Firmicutes bacterium]|nr:class I tRNA ligase family protein [Bacillota bacterium]
MTPAPFDRFSEHDAGVDPRDRTVDASPRHTDAQGDSTRTHVRGSSDIDHVHNDNWSGKLRFYPDRYARTFQHWHENIRDWCISRQLWWGHRIPVWTKEGSEIPEDIEISGGDSSDHTWIGIDVKKDFRQKITIQGQYDLKRRIGIAYACVAPGNEDVESVLEKQGFTQDPDVLDTWFSSALWPMSTMGWPDPAAFKETTPDGSPAIPEGDGLLKTFNPTSVLCTAREIITLWVSRMVMFNIYFRGCLPFRDVFIHAMIQDGHGQKMSKSLGNGVDPIDIIHSHGSDAMRFALTKLTTQTQDVKMPVDMICPYTQQTFTPKFITTSAGHHVAAPTQDSPFEKGKRMASSFGVASGQVAPTDDLPLARNTSEKFDEGRNFANKLWNAVRFALGNLSRTGREAPPLTLREELVVGDQWILSRLARTMKQVNEAIESYEFSRYAQTLRDFIWNDLCDWYI